MDELEERFCESERTCGIVSEFGNDIEDLLQLVHTSNARSSVLLYDYLRGKQSFSSSYISQQRTSHHHHQHFLLLCGE